MKTTIIYIISYLSFFIFGAMNSINEPIHHNVKSNPCEERVSVAFEYEVEDLKVTFTNTSGGNPDIVHWDFGEDELIEEDDNIERIKIDEGNDGSTTHIYQKTGVYEFCLTAIHSGENEGEECKAEFCGHVYVFDPND